MYNKLLEYKKASSDCLVPNQYASDPKLGRWVADQRQFYKKKKLSKQREQMLVKAGFVWDVGGGRKIDEKQWLEMYNKLLEYKKASGDCLVPNRYASNSKLGLWVFN